MVRGLLWTFWDESSGGHLQCAFWCETASGFGGVPLQSIPFPAAIIDRTGTIVATNVPWKAIHRAGQGSGWKDWCNEIHPSSPAHCAALHSGMQAILDGNPTTYLQDCRGTEKPQRTIISPCPKGALVVHEVFNWRRPLPSRDGRAAVWKWSDG